MRIEEEKLRRLGELSELLAAPLGVSGGSEGIWGLFMCMNYNISIDICFQYIGRSIAGEYVGVGDDDEANPADNPKQT